MIKISKLSCFLLVLCLSLYAGSQEAAPQQNPPVQGDGIPQQGAPQSPQSNDAASPQSNDSAQPSTSPQGGDFSNNLDGSKVPSGVILVRGAWASASDSITPVPEGGGINEKVYKNDYFGLSYALPADWYQKFAGPPPSDSGLYVLLQMRPEESFKGPSKATVLVTAQDLFFSLMPGKNALELVNYSANTLRSDYALEKAPAVVTLANRSFVRMQYGSPVAGLHWYVLSTEIRCHALQFVLVSRDSDLLERLIKTFDKMKLPEEAGATMGTGGGSVPVCIKDYARGANVLNRLEPVLPDHKYNPIPVRVIIGKNGKVTHVHLISSFPDQAKIITDALLQWEFKPYLVNGEPVQVETGIMFGLNPVQQQKKAASKRTPIAD